MFKIDENSEETKKMIFELMLENYGVKKHISKAEEEMNKWWKAYLVEKTSKEGLKRKVDELLIRLDFLENQLKELGK